ncbi:MAG: 16S rRNA (adenine(1518)-N(6)/adenine(1519)-N(6))-dimethyltransferase RsmA [Gemmatimonadales bacterium]
MAKKHLGQHFLSDPRILGRIADALGAVPGDPVLEIGPGRGALTAVLLARGYAVTAIERDRDLVPVLRAAHPALHLIEADALDVDWVAAAGAGEAGRWWIIGNIPYNITSPLIDGALAARPAPAAIVFLVQKEVALRLSAEPASSDYGALTVGVRAAAEVERLFSVPAGAFHPPPKVDSAVIRLVPRRREPGFDAAGFRRFVVGLFGARRKQLARGLRTVLDWSPAAAGGALERAGIEPARRPETLSVGEFERLFAVVDGERGAG